MRISLQGIRQHLGHFCVELYKAGVQKRLRLYNTLLGVVTDKLLPERPYRYEPRLKKQRPKPYGWMQQPRNVLKLIIEGERADSRAITLYTELPRLSDRTGVVRPSLFRL